MNSLNSVHLFDVIQAYIQADTWTASQRVIETCPELLSDEADQLLGQLVTIAQQQGDAQAEGAFTEYRQLLARCRQVGVEAAFAQKTKGAEIPSEVEAFLAGLSLEQQQILLDALGLSED